MEMTSNTKMMMRTLNVTMDDFNQAFKIVQSSIDKNELARFNHYEKTGKNPDTDPDFKSNKKSEKSKNRLVNSK